MNIYKLLMSFFSLFLLLGFIGCGSSSDSSSSGSLTVLLTDAPGDFSAVYITLKEVLVHKSQDDNNTDDSGWITVAQPNKTYDLLTLQNGVTEELGSASLSAGKYTQMRLVLGDEDDNGSTIAQGYDSHPFANYVVFTDGGDVAELDVPSNTLKTNHNFEILDNGLITMTIDFDANKSIHQAGASGKWILNPVIDITTQAGDTNNTEPKPEDSNGTE